MLRRRDEVEAVDGVCIGCFLLFIFLLSMMFWMPSHRRHPTTLVDEVTPVTDSITSTSTLRLETKDGLENWKEKRRESGTETSLNTGQQLKESLDQLSQEIQKIKEQIGIKAKEIIDSQGMAGDDYVTKDSMTTTSSSTEKKQEIGINRDKLKDLTQRRLRDYSFQQPIWIR